MAEADSELLTKTVQTCKKIVVCGTREKPVWLDVVSPHADDFAEIARTYRLPQTLVEDVLEPEHLPKFERHAEHNFLILRSFDEGAPIDADTVQEATRKIAIFVGPDFIVTIHRREQRFIENLRQKWSKEKSCAIPAILGDLISEVILSFDAPLAKMIEQFDTIEAKVFGTNPNAFEIGEGYYVRRKASVIKRVAKLTSEILNKLHTIGEHDALFYQDIKDSVEHVYFYADEAVENVDSLLELHISLSSQRTNEASHRINEIMRVLTIFSIFFLPLNFIAGIYGMNFEHMPELKWTYAYPSVLCFMLLVACGIYFWFKRSGWLK